MKGADVRALLLEFLAWLDGDEPIQPEAAVDEFVASREGGALGFTQDELMGTARHG